MNVILNRQVFDKDKFEKTVDTNFSQLVDTPNPVFFDINLATLEDFFILYNKFFYQIPKTGDINSHEFIINESTNYVGNNNKDIQALSEEIAQLREENLQLKETFNSIKI